MISKYRLWLVPARVIMTEPYQQLSGSVLCTLDTTKMRHPMCQVKMICFAEKLILEFPVNHRDTDTD